jgi:hypothetical protein
MRGLLLLSAAAALSGCGQSAQNASSNNGTTNVAAAEAPKPAYCFFRDSETKDWAAKLDKSGNVVVSGKAYREDSRYKAVLTPATVTGGTAEVAPTIEQNDTGFAAPDNWWHVSQTIPNSTAVTSVVVRCGARTLATLTVQRKK